MIIVSVLSWLLILAAWNSLHRGDMGISKCSLLDCDFLLDPTPPHPTPDHFLCFPCMSQVCSHLLVQYSPNVINLTPTPQIWCYTSAITVEISIISFYGLWWILCIKRKKRWGDGASLFSHIKTRLCIDQTFHHVRRWERTDTTEHVWTSSRRRSGENIPSPCTTVQCLAATLLR